MPRWHFPIYIHNATQPQVQTIQFLGFAHFNSPRFSMWKKSIFIYIHTHLRSFIKWSTRASPLSHTHIHTHTHTNPVTCIRNTDLSSFPSTSVNSRSVSTNLYKDINKPRWKPPCGRSHSHVTLSARIVEPVYSPPHFFQIQAHAYVPLIIHKIDR